MVLRIVAIATNNKKQEKAGLAAVLENMRSGLPVAFSIVMVSVSVSLFAAVHIILRYNGI